MIIHHYLYYVKKKLLTRQKKMLLCFSEEATEGTHTRAVCRSPKAIMGVRIPRPLFDPYVSGH